MSTIYAVRLTAEQFKTEVTKLGWVEGKNSQGGLAYVSPNEHYCHSPISFAVNGEQWTTFDRCGRNTDVDELAEELGAISEYDDEFDRIFA